MYKLKYIRFFVIIVQFTAQLLVISRISNPHNDDLVGKLSHLLLLGHWRFPSLSWQTRVNVCSCIDRDCIASNEQFTA